MIERPATLPARLCERNVTSFAHPGKGCPGVVVFELRQCDAKMYHMKRASIRDLRYDFKKVERLLHQGEEVQITKRRRVIARLVPETTENAAATPDFLARLRSIYGDNELAIAGPILWPKTGSAIENLRRYQLPDFAVQP